jgi:fatty-acyl-CoA synthase
MKYQAIIVSDLHLGIKDSKAEEFIEFCRSRMAHYKTPRYVRVVHEFPLTATGKPQKFQMRQSMVNELGLHSPQTA